MLGHERFLPFVTDGGTGVDTLSDLGVFAGYSDAGAGEAHFGIIHDPLRPNPGAQPALTQ